METMELRSDFRAAQMSTSEQDTTVAEQKRDGGARARGWVFTCNNFTEEDEATFRSLIPKRAKYVVYGHEHTGDAPEGTVWTPHLQGYVYLTSQLTLKGMKKIHERCHWEIAAGSPDQCFTYCTKEDKTEFVELGTRPHSGSRNDLTAMRTMVKSGACMTELLETCTSYQALKSAELLMKYQPMPTGDRPVVVRWFWGQTGTGKTRRAWEEARASGEEPWISGKSLQWWQGYKGQKAVIFDDFRGDFCPFHQLLRYLDRYPIQVEFKGGSAWLLATEIWITAPMPPQEAFRNRSTEDQKQLLRRIAEVREFRSVAKDDEMDDATRQASVYNASVASTSSAAQ